MYYAQMNPVHCWCICDHRLCRGLLLSLEQAQEASGQCLRSSEQQMQAQLQDKDSQLQSAQVCRQSFTSFDQLLMRFHHLRTVGHLVQLSVVQLQLG